MARPSRTGGKTSATTTRKASLVKGRNPAKTKRRVAPTAIRLKRASVSARGKELKEAREQQAAMAEILKVIASSPGDVQPVFEAIAESAKRLLGSYHAVVTRVIDDTVHLAAFTAGGEEGDKALQRRFPMPLSGPGPNSRAARTGEIELVADTETYLDNSGIGVITLRRTEVEPFSDKQINLLQTFADQAVIAIGNVRLFDEVQAKTRDLEESLQQQTATADVLKTISRSSIELETVLDTLVETVARRGNSCSLIPCRPIAVRSAAGWNWSVAPFTFQMS
jgi:hypothetical protein